MTVESILTTIESERRWVDNSMRSFQSDLTIDISPCVFQLPKSFSETKPQAYTPQTIGLGPYHHLRPEFFTTERHKLTICKKFLNNDHQVQHFAEEVLDKLWLVEPLIRGYYDKYLDLEGKTLVWILAIDSLYLLNFLNSYNTQDDQGIDDSHERRKLAQDVMMLENQIPSFVLIETRKALFQPYSMLFSEQFYNFCKVHSPLRLTEQREFHSFNSPHLLAYMHHLIVNNRGNLQEEEEGGGIMPMSFQYIVPIVKTAVNLGLPGSQMVAKHVSFMTNLPWDHIKGFVKKEDDEKKPLVIEEIEIPSVTELNEIAKINFKLIEGGIRDIKFVEEEGERVFYLPEITLNSDSEVILRNLVAYEAAADGQNATLELAEYVELMCGIVDTSKDVDLLMKSGIIKGSMNVKEIVDIFNGISKTIGKSKKKEKSELEMAIERVNEEFDNIFRVKAYRIMKKYIYECWKFLAVVVTLVLILLLSLQAFCQVYGCSNRWFHTPN